MAISMLFRVALPRPSCTQDDMQTTIGVPGARSQASALEARTSSANYKVLYSFGASADGNGPQASLINVGGTLYSATEYGGAGRHGESPAQRAPGGRASLLGWDLAQSCRIRHV